MISRSQIHQLPQTIIEHLQQHGSKQIIVEIMATTQGLRSGVQQDIATAREHRGKLGLAAGALGAGYLLKKGAGSDAAQKIIKAAEEAKS